MSDYGQSAQARVEAHRQSEVHIAAQPGFGTQNVVTGTRAVDTVYQNTSGKAMLVSVGLHNNTAGTNCAVYSDAANPPTTKIANTDATYAANQGVTVAFVVKAGNYYKLTAQGGGVWTLDTWSEST